MADVDVRGINASDASKIIAAIDKWVGNITKPEMPKQAQIEKAIKGNAAVDFKTLCDELDKYINELVSTLSDYKSQIADVIKEYEQNEALDSGFTSGVLDDIKDVSIRS